ncbi:LysE family translocator [Caballeronia novacaledonica]|uniref:LysE family translocator n=1 Tax=Caballeronia novacaledonica TaxID=1544861 RepID=A0AA37MVQ6_9BURK|nr:LysE family translocator [Caballeronia novacaledonica]GJH31049.1 LysE family translocator [Caballeronia novacaledonica]
MLPSASFLVAALLLAIVPGPGIAYVVARTVAGGKSEGIASSMGAAIGGMIHVFFAALGLSMLIARSAEAYALVKYIGAAYLVYLGIRTFALKAPADERSDQRQTGMRKAFRDGVIVEALNVKTALFFLAFIPHFLSADHALAPQFIMLGTTCIALNSTVDLVAVFAAHRVAGKGAAKVARQRLMSRLSGATMLVLGILVAVSNREN